MRDHYEKDYYERFFKIGGGTHGSGHRDQFISKIKPYLKGSCLDVGCGIGNITTLLNEIVPTTGIDISMTALKIARRKYPNIVFHRGDIINLPFDDDEFDALVAFDLIEHVADTEKMFWQFNRVLKMDGYLCISTPRFNRLKLVAMGLFDCFGLKMPHLRFYTKKRLFKMLDEFNFEVVHYENIGRLYWIFPDTMFVIARKVI